MIKCNGFFMFLILINGLSILKIFLLVGCVWIIKGGILWGVVCNIDMKFFLGIIIFL